MAESGSAKTRPFGEYRYTGRPHGSTYAHRRAREDYRTPYGLTGFLEEWERRFALRSPGAASRGEVDTLAQRVQGLEEDFKNLRLEAADGQRALLDRIEKLELRAGALGGAEVEPEEDRYFRWCEDNIEILRKIVAESGQAFVAIDVESSTVPIVEVDEGKFVERLKALDHEQRNRLYRIHTSLFV